MGGRQKARDCARGLVRTNEQGLTELIDVRVGDSQAGRFYGEFERDVYTVRYRKVERGDNGELGKWLVGVVMIGLRWVTDKPLRR